MAFMSVIVPFHNNESLVAQTLRGVETAFVFWARQTSSEAPAVEIIAVDDGSADSTLDQIQAFQHDHPHCKLIRHAQPTSPAYARNASVAASSAHLLFFLDGDDSYFQNHLYLCWQVLQDPSVDYVKTGVALTHPVHPDWQRRIANSLVINLAVRRRCHDLIGGFPDDQIARRRDGRIEPVLDV